MAKRPVKFSFFKHCLHATRPGVTYNNNAELIITIPPNFFHFVDNRFEAVYSKWHTS